MSNKEVILNYLENAYSEAKTRDDSEMMYRLSRAIIVFNYDNFENNPDWDKMMDAYLER